jgi:adenylate kinase
MKNIVLFGPPGSGKGTQALRLKEAFNLLHVSTGDIFRAEIKNETELGKLAKSYMDQGQLVPDEVTIRMLAGFIEHNVTADTKGVIFDGFPRTMAQAEALDVYLMGKGSPITHVLSLKVDEEELIRRILERGKTSGRTDDSDESIVRSRMEVYKNQTAPLAAYYTQQGKLMHLDGMGSVDAVFGDLSKALNA